MEGGGRPGKKNRYPLQNAAMNPPNGVVFNYWLGNITDSSRVTVSFFDKTGALMKTFSKDAKEERDRIDFTSGMNQFIWDMNYPPAEKLDGLILWNGNIEGPKVAPGKYRARFRNGKDSAEVTFVIKGDPNYSMTEADYDAQVGMLLQIRDKFSEVQKGIKNIRSIRSQLNAFTERTDLKNHSEVKQLADTINKQLTSIEEALYQTKSKSGQDVLNYPIRINDKLSGLYDVAASGYNPPSKQVKEAYADLSTQADVQLSHLKMIIEQDLVSLNKMINNQNLPVIGINKTQD